MIDEVYDWNIYNANYVLDSLKRYQKVDYYEILAMKNIENP